MDVASPDRGTRGGDITDSAVSTRSGLSCPKYLKYRFHDGAYTLEDKVYR